jgi:hypothetical protein
VSNSTTPRWTVSNVTEDTTFALARLDTLRTKPGRETDLLEQLPDGWSISPVDPTTVLVPFTSLWLRPGFILRAYQFKERGNGNAVVWAVPVDAEFPNPEMCPRLQGVFLAPPKPPGALDDTMAAIEGNGTPWSYLCASLLARELGEFGAMWHGSEWGTHDILGAAPWKTTKRQQIRSQEEAWRWSEPKPVDWMPRAHVADDVVTVTFLTYTALGQEKIIQHTDTFKAGKYQFATQCKVLATGPDGFWW